ncbi:MAG: ABC-2 transporter permease [Tissierellia bacterium]|nr:ABC-2 transporter permease [Tissierellia bacterium]
MTSLIYKDIIRLRKFALLFIVQIILLCSAIAFKNLYNYMQFAEISEQTYADLKSIFIFYSFFTYLFVIKTNAYEFENGTGSINIFIRSMPVDIKEIVISKYMVNIMIILITSIFPILISYILKIITKIDFNLDSYFVVLGILLILNSFDIFVGFTINDKTFLPLITYILIIPFIFAPTLNFDIQSIFSNYLNIKIFVLAIFLNILSSYITYKILKKRQYAA